MSVCSGIGENGAILSLCQQACLLPREVCSQLVGFLLLLLLFFLGSEGAEERALPFLWPPVLFSPKSSYLPILPLYLEIS